MCDRTPEMDAVQPMLATLKKNYNHQSCKSKNFIIYNSVMNYPYIENRSRYLQFF